MIDTPRITIAQAAAQYHAKGWKPVPVDRQSKKAIGKDWPKRAYDPAQFNGNAQNVGVQLGAVSGGLVDIDLDCAAALTLADYFLPDTGAIFGRRSKPRSHHLYIAAELSAIQAAVIPYRAYCGGKPAQMLVELRIGGNGKGAVTTFPPSMHAAGELVEWHRDEAPTRVSGNDLKRAVVKLASACLLQQHYPAENSRHEGALVLGGALARAGWSGDDIANLVEVLARDAHDDDIADRVNTARNAVEVKANGQAVPGLKRLAEIWGQDVADTLRHWLRINERTENNGKNSSGDAAVDAEIVRLAGLSAVQYERERKAAAEKLDIRASVLDRLVQAERPEDDNKQGSAISFPEPEVWPEVVDGAQLLDDIATAVRSHVVMSDAARDTAALWSLHVYLLDCFLVSPRLAIQSPTKRCGKTTLLDVLGRLVLKPLSAAHVTSAAMFRTIEAHRPTLLIDEADTFLRDDDELRGIINSGHRKGGSVLRTVGDNHEPRAFATYAACAIALIGRLPETLHDRSVIAALKRRMPSETITPFRPDRADHLDVLARQAARWAADNAERIGDVDPVMPDGIFNREADNWRPLLAVADAAGGGWPKRARDALEAAHAADDDESRIAMLAVDIKGIYDERNLTSPEDKLGSKIIVEELVMIEGRPWAEYRNGKPITQNQFARILKPHGIAPEVLREGKTTYRGYKLKQFDDLFARYPPSNRNTVTNAMNAGVSDISNRNTPEADVTVAKCEKPNNDGQCYGVAVAKGEIDEETCASETGVGAQKRGNSNDNSDTDIAAKSWESGGETARVCDHCGAPDHPDDPVLERWVAGDQCYLHYACQNGWLADNPALPRHTKVLGLAPGQKCELCGSGRDVFVVQLPVEREGASRHKRCAAQYWSKRSTGGTIETETEDEQAN
jgi:putative DNA primase/helicase